MLGSNGGGKKTKPTSGLLIPIIIYFKNVYITEGSPGGASGK